MEGSDMLSNLPMDISELILKQLSLKDAVKTSILSKGWRYRWTTLPHLVFTVDFCPTPCNEKDFRSLRTKDKERIRTELVSIINHVLLLHSGSIEVFKVIMVPCPSSQVHSWIRRVFQSSVKELVISVSDDSEHDECVLSSSCRDSLNLLDLSFGVLKPPPAFNGFKNLKTLKLMSVCIAKDSFEGMLRGCPLLESLYAYDLQLIKNVRFNAPKLRYLHIGGEYEKISFDDVHPKLSQVSLRFDVRRPQTQSYMTQIFNKFPNVERLRIEGYFLQYLCGGLIPERLPTPCYELHSLALCISLGDVDEGFGALCILRSLPNLTTLDITCFFQETGQMEWLGENKRSCEFDKLKTVDLHWPIGYREELDFIRFVLMNSPALEKMIIYTFNEVDFIVQQMPSFRASTRAQIVCEEEI